MKKQIRPPTKTNLTQEEVKNAFDYDAENGLLIRKTKNGRPYNQPCGHKPICRGYGTVWINGMRYFVHRVIWLWCKGTWPQYEINHIDRNPMNNRIENLEDVDSRTNSQNRGIRNDNKTGYTGVSPCNERGKYRARIRDNVGSLLHLGYHDTPEEASLAYKKAKIKYHPSSPDSKKYAIELGIILP